MLCGKSARRSVLASSRSIRPRPWWCQHDGARKMPASDQPPCAVPVSSQATFRRPARCHLVRPDPVSRSRRLRSRVRAPFPQNRFMQERPQLPSTPDPHADGTLTSRIPLGALEIWTSDLSCSWYSKTVLGERQWYRSLHTMPAERPTRLLLYSTRKALHAAHYALIHETNSPRPRPNPA